MLKIVIGTPADRDAVLDVAIADNRIIRVAQILHSQGERVIFVTKDINARPRAEAAQAPTGAEDHRAYNELAVDGLARVHVERADGGAFVQQPIDGRIHGDRARHHEAQARIPCARDVEKRDHLRRLRHAGEHEAQAKH